MTVMTLASREGPAGVVTSPVGSGRPHAVALGAQPQRDGGAGGHGGVAVAVGDDGVLAVDVDLVLDALPDEQRGLDLAGERARCRVGIAGRRQDLEVLR